MERIRIREIIEFLGKFLQGKEKAIELALISLFSKGHLLIEDLPGLGKTTLAIGLSRSLGLSFGRVQATSDLLPTDITGLSQFLIIYFLLMKSTEQLQKHNLPSLKQWQKNRLQ